MDNICPQDAICLTAMPSTFTRFPRTRRLHVMMELSISGRMELLRTEITWGMPPVTSGRYALYA
jgi:hypothetical protein